MAYSKIVFSLCALLVASPVIAQEDEKTNTNGLMLNIGFIITPGFAIEDRVMSYDQDAREPDRTLAKGALGANLSLVYSINRLVAAYGICAISSHAEKQLDYGVVDFSRLGVGLRITPPLKGNVRPYICGQISNSVFKYRYREESGNIAFVSDFGKHKAGTRAYRIGIEFPFPDDENLKIDLAVTFEHNRFKELDHPPLKTMQINIGFSFY